MRCETIESTLCFEGTSFTVVRESFRLPSGEVATKDIVRHPGAVVVIPVASDGRLLLIRQYRHATQTSLLEFPAGTLERGEAPLECARREIQEETGYAGGSWTAIGTAYPAPGFCDELHHYFLASDLSASKLPADDDEIIELAPMTLSEVQEAIESEELIDCKSITAFTKALAKGLLVPSAR